MPCTDPREDYQPHLPWEVILEEDRDKQDALIHSQMFREAAKLVLAAFQQEHDAKIFARQILPTAIVRRCPC